MPDDGTPPLARPTDDLVWIVRVPVSAERDDADPAGSATEQRYSDLMSACVGAVEAVKDADPDDLTTNAEIIEVRDGRSFSWGYLPPHPVRDREDALNLAREVHGRIRRAGADIIDSQQRAKARVAEHEERRRRQAPERGA